MIHEKTKNLIDPYSTLPTPKRALKCRLEVFNNILEEKSNHCKEIICIFAVSYETTNTVYMLGKYLPIASC